MKKLFPSLLPICLLFPALLAAGPLAAQLLARIQVKQGAYRCINLPVSIMLSPYALHAADSLQFTEVNGSNRKPVPYQVDGAYMSWILDGPTGPNTTRTFELSKVTAPGPHIAPFMQLKDSAGSLLLLQQDAPLLCYNYGTVYPPAGVDTVYRRSGFIHPVWTPDGQIITNMHPNDHWHHLGIWNPWTHTEFKGKETDFWNLHKKQGTVRFKGFISRTAGDVQCGFTALQDHIAFTGNKEIVAINEEWKVRAYKGDNRHCIWDFSSLLNCADTSGITMLLYRYGGGFGLRATAAWNAATSQVLTSEGKTRNQADSTRARWVKITGTDKGKQAGILVLCHPDNFDYPQPLRVWPENSEKGEIMLNFSPTKMRSWKLNYGRSYALHYRVMVYTGDLTAQEAENAWQAFAHPPVVNVTWTSVPVQIR